MTDFSREINDFSQIVSQWNSSDHLLFRIRTDLIEKGEAILVFRNNEATAYYNGNRLCNIGTRDNVASMSELFLPFCRSKILDDRTKKKKCDYQYIDESIWKEKAGIGGLSYSFSDILPEICSNIRDHKTPESFQVSNLYKYSPLNPNNTSNIVLLDVEAVFAVPGTRKSDRIDLVFYHTEAQQLIFVEAKGLWDSRLKAVGTKDAEILEQMARYEKILKDSQESANIKLQYNRVIEYYNKLGGLNIKPIEDKDPLLGLLLFGYTDADKEKRVKVREMLTSKKIKYYEVGNTTSVTNNTLIALHKRFSSK
jgi:hypothetical protein